MSEHERQLEQTRHRAEQGDYIEGRTVVGLFAEIAKWRAIGEQLARNEAEAILKWNKAKAWDEGWDARDEDYKGSTNPYREAWMK